MAYQESLIGFGNEKEGKVTVCTARDCRWNDESRCIADAGVMVNLHMDHADCNTYTKNEHIPGLTPGTARF